MSWSKASEHIIEKVKRGINIDPDSKFRLVLAGPDYACHNYNYDGERGYKVRIGENASIEIPMSMLKVMYQEALTNNGIYNNGIFKRHFELQKNHHPCHVHVVGNFFLYSGVAKQINKRNYRILGLESS
ncbi:hypothetical protein QA597_10435 [Marinilabiliaceae bacterium ANBcel2]|nr:hypothetical protein [Marinilabiliaceae bacterium ANBcel2]